MERMHIDMLDEDDDKVTRPVGITEHVVPEPFAYSPLAPNALPNPHSHAPSSAAAASQGAPQSSVEPPSSSSAPSAPASSSSGGGKGQRSEGDSSLRSQVQILMNELANMRAQQTLNQQTVSGTYAGNGYSEEEPPPPDYMTEGRRSLDLEGAEGQRSQSVRRTARNDGNEKTLFRDS